MTMSLLSKISRPFVSKTTQKLSAKSCGGVNNVAVRSMAGDAESRTSAVSNLARDLSTRMHCAAIGTFQNSISSPIILPSVSFMNLLSLLFIRNLMLLLSYYCSALMNWYHNYRSLGPFALIGVFDPKTMQLYWSPINILKPTGIL